MEKVKTKSKVTKVAKPVSKPKIHAYGRYIIMLRKNNKLSISEMARIAGMSVSFWSQMEKGQKAPPTQSRVNMNLSNHTPLLSGESFIITYDRLEALCGRMPPKVLERYQCHAHAINRAIIRNYK